MDESKKGIALFITLLVIASILSIIAVSFSYLDKAHDDAGKASSLIQANLLYTNTTNILKTQFPGGKQNAGTPSGQQGSSNSQALYFLYTSPIILNEEISGFSLNLQCQPLMSGVPMQWLDEQFSPNVPERYEAARKVLTYIIEEYRIEEPYELEQLIFSAITGIKEYNSDFEPRIKPPRGIHSKQQFERILFEYRLNHDDPNVLKVPWEQYFVFSDIDKESVIDGKYLTAEVISAYFEIPLDIVREQWVNDPDTNSKPSLKDFLADNGVYTPPSPKVFSDKGLNAMHCEESYAYRGNHYRFSFDYKDGRSLNFEFHEKL